MHDGPISASPPQAPIQKLYEAASGDRRAMTRTRLLNAAVDLFSERGIEQVSVLDITTKADVSNGTFYNYFKDRDDLAISVCQYITESLISNIIDRLDRIADARCQIALGVIWMIDAVAGTPCWGRMMMSALSYSGLIRDLLSGTIRRHVERGVAQRHFSVPDLEVHVELHLAALSSAIGQALNRGGGKEAGIAASRTILQMLGLSPAKARPIPESALRTFGEQLEIPPSLVKYDQA